MDWGLGVSPIPSNATLLSQSVESGWQQKMVENVSTDRPMGWRLLVAAVPAIRTLSGHRLRRGS